MNARKWIVIVAAVSATGSVFAAEVTEGVWPAFTSTKTRAEVVAELAAAKADGSYALAHQQYAGQFPDAALRYAKASEARKPVVVDNAVKPVTDN